MPPQPIWTPSAARIASTRLAAFTRALHDTLRPRPAGLSGAVALLGRTAGRFLDRGVGLLRHSRSPRRARRGRSRPHAGRPLLSRRQAQFRRERAAPQRRHAGDRLQRRIRPPPDHQPRPAVHRRPALRRRLVRGRHPPRRPRCRLHAEPARDDCRRAGRRGDRRGLDVVLAGLRRAGSDRSIRPDRAADPGRADGYFYAGKTLDAVLPRLAEILARLPSVRAGGRRSLRRPRIRAWRAAACGRRGRSSSAPLATTRSTTFDAVCRSTIRSTSSTPPARPACPSASSTAPAARCSSISRSTSCTATSSPATACSTSRPAAG